ncbi:glycosyltransferase [Aquimarina sp. ERC-38]|uniref:glycosyltransferase n=1 Tax=Aquimarina sp. ERC-38 TaxID=2949996 RepID=UPI002246156E|nr:glycosyltransferase [Aquimarina sp. ERC-38]UZO79664.1 glycosyltransferase [Aquimarina sp. ERC-38]
MKIILTSIGTRGDMEPFLAIGEILKAHGHQVICLFPEQFRHLAIDSGFEFASLGSKFIELLDSSAGRIAMSGGKFGIKKLKAYRKLISMQPKANEEIIKKHESFIEAQKPDRIIHHSKAIYPLEHV